MDSAYFRYVVKYYVDSLKTDSNRLDLKRVVVAGNADASRQMLFSFAPKEWEGAIQNEAHMRINARLIISVDSHYILTYYFK